MNLTNEEMIQIFNAMDLDKSEKIDYSGFH